MAMTALLDPFVRMLDQAAPPAVVRAIENGGSTDDLWAELSASGYLDALVPESAGGAGLTMADAGPVLMALGAAAMPLPVAETMLARALLAEAGLSRPDGPIVLVASAWPVPAGAVAQHMIYADADQVWLADIAERQPTGVHGDLAATLVSAPAAQPIPGVSAEALRACAAVVRATAIAGAAERLLAMTVAYANDRVQFGKPIGKQQAVQQQLAVMAELCIAARFASQIGCADGLVPSLQAAATAKYAASAAAADIAAIAHAVHGAIGISADYDLQLLTRRLHQWRLADGSDSYWATELGALYLSGNASALDFIRTA